MWTMKPIKIPFTSQLPSTQAWNQILKKNGQTTKTKKQENKL